MKVKDRMISLRIPASLHDEYKEFCETNSFVFSKRIRKLMEVDLEKWKKFMIEESKKSSN